MQICKSANATLKVQTANSKMQTANCKLKNQIKKSDHTPTTLPISVKTVGLLVE